MGKRFRKNKRSGQAPSYEKPKKERSAHYEELIRENKNFEIFYKAQNVVPPEEWDSFMSCLKDDLPAAFRLTGSKSQSFALLKIMKEKFFDSQKGENGAGFVSDNKVVDKPLEPLRLPWYPDGLAWQLNLTRKDIRRSESYWQLHQFLISETETGNISRQEAVSMIPPVLLDVHPHHKILDMCAAPGSKTAQIIEIMHSKSTELDNVIPLGIVVANDVDNKRCYMLTHQAKRMQSPTLLITNHDASFMPNIMHTREDGSTCPIKFDRVLCDVPCSGDGTLRKNFDVWTKWNAVNGANLHGLQLRIARRGIEMLAVGGRMVYSTCSFNPLENEAVINRLLAEAKGSLKLCSVTNLLPGLKFVPGLETWTVMTRELEAISADEIPSKVANHFHPCIFPPPLEVAKERGLSKCIRILPHHQNTGGFFVAVLEKVALLSGEKIYPLKTKTTNDNVEETEGDNTASHLELTQRVKPPPKKRCRGYREEPFFYMAKNDTQWKEVLEFFGTDNSFDKGITPDLLLSRTSDGTGRNIYFTNALIKDVIDLNQERMKLINAGVKVLVRCQNKGSKCNYRLAQDGIHTLSPLFSERKIIICREDLVLLLLNEDVEEPPQLEAMNVETQKQCSIIESGSTIFVYNHKHETNKFNICMVGWKGKSSLRCYVTRPERVHYLRILGEDTSTFEKNKYEFAKIATGGGDNCESLKVDGQNIKELTEVNKFKKEKLDEESIEPNEVCKTDDMSKDESSFDT